MGNNISSPYMPTSNNVKVPVEMKSDLGMFCLSLQTSDKIELIHASPVVVDCVRKVANEVNGLITGNDKFKTPSKDMQGALQFKMSARLFKNPNTEVPATMGKVFCVRLIEELHKIGYDLQIGSDLNRYSERSKVIWKGAVGSLFFRKVTSERPPAKVLCVAPGWEDTIELLNHSESVKKMVENAIKDAASNAQQEILRHPFIKADTWPFGIQKQEDREVLGHTVHEIKMENCPWKANELYVYNNEIINMIVGNLSKINLKLVGGINIKRGTESLFFIEDTGSHAQLSSISLYDNNGIRLVDCKYKTIISVRQAITKSGFRIQDESESEHQINMRLNGIPSFELRHLVHWRSYHEHPWHCSGAERVRSRQLVARISEVMLQQGWALTGALDMSRPSSFGPEDKSMLLFRKCVPTTASFSCICLTSAGNLRLIDFSPGDQEVLKTCILENYLPGVSVRNTSGAESNSLKFTLAGEPWCSHAGGLHARSLLVHLFAAAVNLGFQIAASANVSSKHTTQGENLYRDDVPCLLDVHSIFLVKMPPKPASDL